jgi:hypothetical protein
LEQSGAPAIPGTGLRAAASQRVFCAPFPEMVSCTYRLHFSNSRTQSEGKAQAVIGPIRCDRRLLIVLLLLCVTVLAQSSALSGQTESHHSPDHCCLLCHVGPLPFLQTSVSAVLAPALQIVWMAPPARLETVSDVLVIPAPSRAPPSV